ncbi:MAG: DUF5947 family protein [Sandaracinaceae bacterium]
MSLRGVAALRRLTRPLVSEGRCGLCAGALAEPHPHLIEPASRRIECACPACALLFDGASGSMRRIGTRVRAVDGEDVALAWDRLALPVSPAFVARWSRSDGTTIPIATSPSPLGAVDHALSEGAMDGLARAHPAIAAMRPDVEALLVRRRPFVAYVVPIDRAFALIGRMRGADRGSAERIVDEALASLERARA